MEVLQRTANRGSISTGYDIPGSIKFEENNTEGMYAQPTAAGNRRTWTVSAWFKRTEITRASTYMPIVQAQVGSETGSIYITPTDHIIVDVGYGGTRNRMQTKAVYRDASAWYHIVWRVDTTQGTAANRNRVYINGVLQELDTIDGYPAQNFESFFNNNIPIYVGTYGTTNNYGYCGYMAEIQMTDGVSNAPTEFGEFDEDSGIWKPIEYEGSYGAQGFYLPFDDVSAIGKNGHGNDVNFTLQNISAADYSTDTPTNNFCTWNPLAEINQQDQYGNARTISEGSTKIGGSTGWGGVKASIGVTNGKWYWENKSSGVDTIVGWQTENNTPDSGSNSHNTIDTVALYEGGNYVWIKDSTSGRNDEDASGSNASGQIIGFALDLDSSPQTATFYRNGSAITSNVNIDGATGKTLFPFISQYNYNTETNFGGYTTISISSAASDANGYGTFEYAPPTGYYAICTKNLAEYG